MKVLNRLDEKRGILSAPIPTEIFRKMYEVAQSFEAVGEAMTTESPDQVDPDSDWTKILSGPHSYLQMSPRGRIPYHFQIVVPGVSGTSSAGQLQLYEIAVWERCLLQVFCQVGVSIAVFEFGGFGRPLLIDVFPVPPVQTAGFYWKSAFEEMEGDMNSKIIPIVGRSMKGVFPPGSKYCVVTFDDGKGLGRIWEGGANPREIAVEVVCGLWRESDCKPPSDLESEIRSFDGWPT
jgi:hypothetical protein